jgi:hypothetical protein
MTRATRATRGTRTTRTTLSVGIVMSLDSYVLKKMISAPRCGEMTGLEAA